MKRALVIAVVLLAAIVAPVLFMRGDKPPGKEENLPWQIEALPDGTSRVFGLTLGRSTLADARGRFGADMELAILAAANEPGALEAYYARIEAGFVTGVLILTAQASPETIAAMRRRAVKSEYVESGARRFRLHPDDVEAALNAPLAAISFIPSVNLDEAAIVQRFGRPAERVRGNEHAEHLLYPDKGLDLVLDQKGKELLQYVPPREFARLRAPLAVGAAAQ